MTQVYTDASLAEGFAYTSCIILNDSNFMGYHTFEFDNVDSSLRAELLGIIEAIRYSKLLGITDEITVFTDSEASLILFNNSKANQRIAKQYTNEIRTLTDLLDNNSVTLRYIMGHSSCSNPNKLVDLTSHSLLNYKLSGVM